MQEKKLWFIPGLLFLSIFNQPLYHANGRKDGKQNGSNQTSNG